MPTTTEQTPAPRPLVGAIRWDAWHGEQGGPGRAVQHALGPRQWHGRLPFFARIEGDDAVRIDGTSQAVMDQEIAYAAAAGLAYWAFVTYDAGDAMSLGLARYLTSAQRGRLPFCCLSEATRWRKPEYVARLVGLMAEPGYLTVLGGRPVLYLGFLSPTIEQQWGNRPAFRAVLDEFRAAVRARGLGAPYVVIMDFNAERGREWLDALGADALSSYAMQGGASGAPYSALAAHAEAFWERCCATGAGVAPIIMSGWDRRPRVARPMPWETWQKPGAGIEKCYAAPTPAELAAHCGRAVAWMDAHPAAAPARLAIIYAWNENDEGGWLTPTLTEGSARLDALATVLRPGK